MVYPINMINYLLSIEGWGTQQFQQYWGNSDAVKKRSPETKKQEKTIGYVRLCAFSS